MKLPMSCLLILALLLGACTSPEPVPSPQPSRDVPGTEPAPGTGEPTTGSTALPPVPADTPIPTATYVRPGSAITLTLWTTDELAPTSGTQAGSLLAVQIDTFKNTHPNVRVQIVHKLGHGPGGLLDFLSSAAPVAPDVVPDLMVLDVGEVPGAAQAGLLTPLDDLLPEGVKDDLFPFARTGATVNGQLYGLPFTADVQHLTYNRVMVINPPVTWTGVLSETNQHLIFAAGSAENMDATLADYLAAGGTLVDAGGRPHLDAAPLATVLSYYRNGRESGTIVDSPALTESPADAWQVYRAGKAGLAIVNASLYLADRDSLRTTAVAPPPGLVAPGAGIARSWAWVVPQRNDPNRRQLAIELLAWLASPNNLGDWTLADARLPARRTALQNWPAGDAYVAFLLQYLETARPQPPAEVDARLAPALYRAAQAVLVNGVAPEAAAGAAAAEVAP